MYASNRKYKIIVNSIVSKHIILKKKKNAQAYNIIKGQTATVQVRYRTKSSWNGATFPPSQSHGFTLHLLCSSFVYGSEL